MNRTTWNNILRVRTHHTTVYETPLSTDGIKFADVNVGNDGPGPLQNEPHEPKKIQWKESAMEPNYQQDSVSEPIQKLITWPEPLKRKREEEPFRRNVRKRYDDLYR